MAAELHRDGARVGEEMKVPPELPILSSKEAVIYPYMILPIAVTTEGDIRLIDDTVVGERKMVGLFAQRSEAGMARPEELYSVGTAANIARMLKMPDGSVQVLLQGVARIRLRQLTQTEPYMRGRIEVLHDLAGAGLEVQALARNVISLFQRVVSLAPGLPQELAVAALNIQPEGKLADFVAAHINLSLQERQEILETLDVAERLKKVTHYINRELEILDLGSKIQSQMKEQMNKTQREYYLREQLKAIQRELGETDEREAEVNELRRKVEEAHLPPEAKEEAERELGRLSTMPPASPEHSVIRTYLDWLINLPWDKETEDNLDIGQAERVLDNDHYDLEKVTARILEYLAVRKLKADMRGPILCFVGPPGVGKTSLGQSIARALGRKFIRMSLGGVRDEAEIRGHRRTYVGALPGRIIQGMRRVGSRNPVFMLDEVDKLGTDFRGDPSAALLEVLNPAQNFSFMDHYLDVAFDLSKVMFITTANFLDPVPPALHDRMEVLELPGYTDAEKVQIARRFLVPKQLSEHGLTPEQLEITQDALEGIVANYTREAGVRNLEREIATLCRKVARDVAQGREGKIVIDASALHPYLGPQRFRHEAVEEADEVGVATGVAVTPVGGDVLFVEASRVPGRGRLILTGHLGDVMQESARAALTYARSRAAALGIEEDFSEKNDIHIHVPAGAIPKDGPSAGVTMAVALISALTRRPVRREVIMTGEITLRGKVLPIGGLKEKALAAHRAGAKFMVIPRDNEKDLEEVPAHVREEIRFVPVSHMDEVLNLALQPKEEKERAELVVATP